MSSPSRRPLLPRPISYQDYGVPGPRDQLSGPIVITNSNSGRRRSGLQFRASSNDPLFTSFDDFDLPRTRVSMANRRQSYRYAEVFEEQGPEWLDDTRISGYRHVRRLD